MSCCVTFIVPFAFSPCPATAYTRLKRRPKGGLVSPCPKIFDGSRSSGTFTGQVPMTWHFFSLRYRGQARIGSGKLSCRRITGSQAGAQKHAGFAYLSTLGFAHLQ